MTDSNLASEREQKKLGERARDITRDEASRLRRVYMLIISRKACDALYSYAFTTYESS